MQYTKKQLLEWLALYGAAVEEWPEEVRAEGMRARHNPDFALLIESHRRFEILLRDRPLEAPRADFPERIVAAIRPRAQHTGFGAWLYEAFAEMTLPKPAFTLTAVLALGIAIGFILPAQSGRDESLQAYFEDYGAVL